MNSHRAILWGITLGLALSPAPALAQQALSADLRTPGVAVDTIVPGVQDQAAASTVTELVRGRAPGLNILESSGVAGASPRMWIRGPQSILLADEPLVVVDGVRIISDPDAFGSDLLVRSTSRLADLSPDDVASVRVLRGPAGAAAYGPEGASGVLEITTRRDQAPWLHAWSSMGVRQQATNFPVNHGRRAPWNGVYDTDVGNCTVLLEVLGRCVPYHAGVSTTDPLRADSAFRAGVSTNVGVRLSGSAGGGRAGYLLSAGTQRVEGTLRDNADALRHLRGSLSLRAGGARLAVTAAHARRETDLPITGTHVGGIIGRGLAASGVPFLAEYGWRFVAPLAIGEDARHTTLGASADYDVLSWLSVGARGGRDESRSEGGARYDARVPFSSTEMDEQTRWHWSARATARAGRADGVRGALTAGVERLGAERTFRRESVGVGGTASGEESFRLSRDQALFAHATAQWRSLTVGGTVRGDQPDRGRDDETRLAYSLGGEWALDGVLPRGGWVGAVTLRAAHGRVARGLEWLRTPSFVLCPTSGCPPLPPLETATETEAGVDARLFGRVDLGVTGYLRRTDDLLILGGGWSGASAFESGGEVHNRGVELAATVHGPENRAVGWRVDLAAAANRNEYRADGGMRFPSGLGTYHSDGYPLGSYFESRITGFADLNGDGVLAQCDNTACEVEFSPAREYAGTPTPDRLASLAGTLRLRRASLHVRADWAGGAEMLDYTTAYRCAERGNCAAAYDRNLPLRQQAEILAAEYGSLGGFVRSADFARLREVALTLSAPSGWAARLGGAQVDLTVAGRNLATWTDYPGLDPETSAGGPDLFGAFDSFEQPLSRSIVTRIDVRF